MFVSVQACAEQVQYQLPNTHSRKGYLMNAILCSGAPLQASIPIVQTDDGMHGMHNDFEATVAHLVAYDPVAKKKAVSSGNNEGSALISAAEGYGTDAEVAGMIGKPSIGKTRIHLQFHKGNECSKLMPEQKAEFERVVHCQPQGSPEKRRQIEQQLENQNQQEAGIFYGGKEGTIGAEEGS